MANEIIARFGPLEFINNGSTHPVGGSVSSRGISPTGNGAGLAFPTGVDRSVYAGMRIPNAAALATGITAELAFALPPGVISVGKNAVFGITIGPITSATTTFDENASTGALVSCTEVLATVTLSPSPIIVTASFAIAIAKMNSLAAGGHALVKVRRNGTSASDTLNAPAVLLWADFRNT